MWTMMTKLAAAILLSSSAAAFAAAPSYVASFAAPVTQAKLVSSDRMWTCSDSVCVTRGAADSPPQHVCSRLAREMGVIASFSVRGEAFSAEALAACNVNARRPSA